MGRVVIRCLVPLALAATSCNSPKFKRDTSEGDRFRTDLIAAIRSAKTIRVVEHSCPSDFPSTGKPNETPEERVYREEELSPEARSRLLEGLKAMNPATQDAMSACIMQTHHTLYLEDAAGGVSRMDICFQCRQVKWPGTAATNPWAFFPVMDSFLRDEGFQPTRDWEAAAREWKSSGH